MTVLGVRICQFGQYISCLPSPTFFILFYLAMPCGMQDLNSPTRNQTVEEWSLSHWTTRKVPPTLFIYPLK